MSPSRPSRETPTPLVPVPAAAESPPVEAPPPRKREAPQWARRFAQRTRERSARLRRKYRPSEIVRFRAVRDVFSALFIVFVVLGGLSLATGGSWPPLLVVESGSMMHSSAESPYGRVGSIDVGDIIFIKRSHDAEGVQLWVDGGKEYYGRPGHVMSFAANGNRDTTTNVTIIHRAITYVTVDRDLEGRPIYTMKWLDGETKTWGAAGIYFPALGFDERFGFSPTAGYRPAHSGFITKGDNAFTNPASDQALGISRIVDATWVEGTVHGEIPWMGLGKLALQNGRTNPNVPGWERIGNAFAPLELWSMFFLVVGLILIIPLLIDTHRVWRYERERTRRLAIAAEENRANGPAKEKGPVEFQPMPRRRTP